MAKSNRPRSDGWVRIPTGGVPGNPSVFTTIRDAVQGLSEDLRRLSVDLESSSTSSTEVVGGSAGGLGAFTGKDIATGGPFVASNQLPDSAPPNNIFAGPTSGVSSAEPAFRLMVAADLPASGVTAGTYGTSAVVPVLTVDAKGRLTNVVATSIGSLDAGVITTGTFDPARIPNLDASKITTGQLAVARGGTGVDSAAANTVFAGPNGSSGAPSFRTLVSADIPSLSGLYLPLTGGTLTGQLVSTTNVQYPINVSTSFVGSSAVNLTNTSNDASANIRLILNNDANNNAGFQLRSSTHATEPNDAVLYSGSGSINLYTGGNSRVKVTSTGQVRIGTNTSTSASATASLEISAGNGVATTTILRAFGTVQPSYSTWVARGTFASPTANQTDDTLMAISGRGYGDTGFAAGSRVIIYGRAAETWTDTAQGTYLSFFTTTSGITTSTEKMRLSDAGRLGIGTTSPQNPLDVVGDTTGAHTARVYNSNTAGRAILSVESSGSALSFYSYGSTYASSGAQQALGGMLYASAAATGGMSIAVAAAAPIRFYTSGTADSNERMRLTSDGKLGLNVTTPIAKLHASDATSVLASALYSGSDQIVVNNDGSGTNPSAIRLVSSNSTGLAEGTSSAMVFLGTRGTNAVPVATASGDYLGRVIFQGYTGTARYTAVSMQILQESAVSGGRVPAYLAFFTASTTQDQTERMRVTSTGDVIFGKGEDTASPVGGTLRAPNRTGTDVSGTNLSIAAGTGTGTAGSGSIVFFTGQASGTSGSTANPVTERMRLNSAGNVGIGTSSPSHRLTIKTPTVAGYIGLEVEDYTETTGIYIQSVSGGAYRGISANSTYYNASQYRSDSTVGSLINLHGGEIKFYTDTGLTVNTDYTPSERMRITSAGRVGIGTTPTVVLDVAETLNGSSAIRLKNSSNGTSADARVILGNDTADTAGWILRSSTNTNTAEQSDAVFYVTGANNMHWYTNGNRWMTLDSSGKVGIGITNPGARMEFSNTNAAFNTTTPGTSRYGIHFRSGGTDDYATGITWAGNNGTDTQAHAGIYVQGSGFYGTKMYFATTGVFVTGATTAMMIDGQQRVGIGNVSPTEKLDVTGNAKFSGTISTSSTTASTNTTTGALTVAGGVGIAGKLRPSIYSGFNIENNAGSTYTYKLGTLTGDGSSVIFEVTSGSGYNDGDAGVYQVAVFKNGNADNELGGFQYAFVGGATGRPVANTAQFKWVRTGVSTYDLYYVAGVYTFAALFIRDGGRGFTEAFTNIGTEPVGLTTLTNFIRTFEPLYLANTSANALTVSGGISVATTIAVNGSTVIDVSRNLTNIGTITAGATTITGNGGFLDLVGTDHAYIEFYPRTVPTGRKAYIGFASTSTTNLSIINEDTGTLTLQTTNNNINLTTGTGNVLLGVSNNANGGVLQLKSGITFPAARVAATDVNTLDDYEEGTWTPALVATGITAWTVTTVGRYTLIGNLVTVYGRVAVTAVTGTGSGNLTMSGLPFATANVTNLTPSAVVTWSGSTSNIISIGAAPNTNATTLVLRKVTAAGTSNTSNLAFSDINTASFVIEITLSYYIS